MAEPEVFPWLKSLPVAPEYRPTEAEFRDPIGYIFKIEKEASRYGICKIIPPVLPCSKKTALSNLTRSQPSFTTRQQQIGFCPRRPQPVRRPVWQSGTHYTFKEFEAKAKAFEKTYLKKHYSKKTGGGGGGAAASSSAAAAAAASPSPLEVETLYWKATLDKPFSVEYANDMPGSAFGPVGDGEGECAWNMRVVSRANGSLLRFMKEEIPGVTSPMVYVAMLFSWFAWHVEDHDLHSLNYMHLGAPKTWYGVPRDAAFAFEEVVRVHGYGGEINPLVTFAVLGEKTTVMSPEVFINAGVPCCRLVQNAGEFVVTFPGAYHTGFSHGFNCGEASNIATPEWLRVAKDAAIRRASINYPPMVSHFQLLYDLGLALCSRIPGGNGAEPHSSRLKDKRRGEGETVIKELFVQDVLQNNDLLHVLGKGSAVVLLPHSSYDFSVCSKLRIGSQQLKVNPGSVNASNSKGINYSGGFISDDLAFATNHGIKQVNGFSSVKEKFATLCERNWTSSLSAGGNICTSSSKTLQKDTEKETTQGDGLSDQRLFSCVTCGILSFACVAIVQPKEPAARYLMSADRTFFNDWIVGSGVNSKNFVVGHEDATIPESSHCAGWTKQNAHNDLYDASVQSAKHSQIADQNYMEDLNTERIKGSTALSLLASAYGNSSDSEEDQGDSDIAVSSSQEISCLPSHFENSHASPGVRLDRGDDIPLKSFDSYEDYMHKRVECIMSPPEHSVKSDDYDFTSGVAYRNMTMVPHSLLNCSQDASSSLVGKSVIPVGNKHVSLVPPSNEDSSRLHVFCLEHAAEAEKQLRPIGGAHILLLCHPDYPKIEAEAKFVAEELGIDYMWKNTAFRHADKDDEERIQSALDSEEAIPGNGDWAVKLGINLFYSANLSRSPLYSKQMPYNSVIHYAFGCSSTASSPPEPKVYRRRANKQKKVVAGNWCGKVWMANQVHPLLAKGDAEDVEDEKRVQGWPLHPEKIERSAGTLKSNTAIRNSDKKRKMVVESGGSKRGSFAKRDLLSDDSIEDKSNQDQRTILRSKRTRHIKKDDAASERDYSPLQHHRKPTKCIESDGISSDSLGDSSHIERRKNANDKEAELTDNDVVSDDMMNDDSDSSHRGELSSKQDTISEDSLGVGSLELHRKTPKSKYGRYIAEEDVISDHQMEVYSRKQQKRIPKSKQHKFLFGKDTMVSDDQLEHHVRKQQRKKPRREQDKYLAGEDIISDDQLEVHSLKYQRRIPKSKQAKCIAQKDGTSDGQVKNHFQKQLRSGPRSRPIKCCEREIMDDSTEDKSHILHRTPKRKQPKCTDAVSINSDDQMEEDSLQHRRTVRGKQSKSQTILQMKQDKCKDEDSTNSDDQMEGDSQLHRRTVRGKKPKSQTLKQMKKQAKCKDEENINSDDHMEDDMQHKRTVRSKQSKPQTLQQIKQANSLRVRSQTSRPMKRSARILMKSKAPRQIKQQPRVQNNQSDVEEEEEEEEEEEKKEVGGPSTRLRKRVPKLEESEGKSKEKESKRKKAKGATAAKVSTRHAKMKAEEAEFQCDMEGCTMSFGSKQELMHHKRNICPVKGCGKKFFSHKYLVQHRRVHEDDRPLKCPWKGCKMTFKWAWARTEHIRVHTGARPYVCAEPDCGQTFRFVSDFSRHKRKTGHSTKKSC